jgi:hypothetical protein
MKGCRRQLFGLCRTLCYSILRFGRPCDFVFRDQRKSQRAAELTRAYGGERRPDWVTFSIFPFSISRFSAALVCGGEHGLVRQNADLAVGKLPTQKRPLRPNEIPTSSGPLASKINGLVLMSG